MVMYSTATGDLLTEAQAQDFANKHGSTDFMLFTRSNHNGGTWAISGRKTLEPLAPLTPSRKALMAMCELLCNGLEHIDDFDDHSKQLNTLDEAIYDLILAHHVRQFGPEPGPIDYQGLIAAADTLASAGINWRTFQSTDRIKAGRQIANLQNAVADLENKLEDLRLFVEEVL